MVIRQSRLHLADLAVGVYPMQALLDIVIMHIANLKQGAVCEVGCGVGRLIGEAAQLLPDSHCYGVDYSYQMLRQAQRYWLSQQAIDIRDDHLGYATTIVPARAPLPNLSLLMADATDLPFMDASVDVVLSCFLLDRLADPLAALSEWCRILQPDGKMIIATPLNWQTAAGWRDIPDGKALTAMLIKIGLQVQSHQHILIKEPIDARSNYVGWHTEMMIAEKA